MFSPLVAPIVPTTASRYASANNYHQRSATSPLTTTWSFSMRVRAASIPSGSGGIMFGRGNDTKEIVVTFSTSSKLLCANFDGTNANSGSTTVVLGRWYRVAGSYSGGRLTLWLDDTLQVNNVIVTAPTADAITIGGSAGTSSGNHLRWDGRIRDVRIWSGVALTLPEHRADAASPYPIKQLGALWAWWGVTGPNDTVDRSGNGRPLTTTGTIFYEPGPGARSRGAGGVPRRMRRAYLVNPSSSTIYEEPLSESMSMSEAVTGKLVLPGNLAESASMSEAVTGQLTLLAPAAESLTMAEACAEILRFPEPLSESMAMSESVTGRLTLLGNVAESMSMSESVTGRLTLLGPLAETLTIAEALTVFKRQLGDLSESMSMSESMTGRLVLGGAVAESMALAESITAGALITGALSESMSMSESMTGRLVLPGALSESMSLSESVTGKLTLLGSVAESLTIAEALTVFKRQFGALAESMGVAESVSGRLVLLGALAESLAMSATLAGMRRSFENLSESMAMSESEDDEQSTGGVFLSESMTISESVSTRLIAAGSLAESMTMSENVAGRLTLLAPVAEALALAEAVAVFKRQFGPLSESMAMAEAVATRLTAVGRLAETLHLSEGVTGVVPGSFPPLWPAHGEGWPHRSDPFYATFLELLTRFIMGRGGNEDPNQAWYG